ncbi:copper amine oxidase domain protein, putative [Heliomicrobium modesticaldum Ice1]|uniref:Copper amine oxidase domain protein, putative n=1 Tax=Heliobacterium modesticaldum (strain ATCC 51547 / Ice1) TaxID=498761 RepID=B0THK8_HELMI|nr:copper amine oxidase N-terminal domain-containing protein [Heliomicrobium modesticaldum]ABZ83446.1 copper amine oxidase domain protein, putative [Heliomicrobium modesticaldum Ice1]
MASRLLFQLFAIALLFLSLVPSAFASLEWQPAGQRTAVTVIKATKDLPPDQYYLLMDGKLYRAGNDHALTLISNDKIWNVYVKDDGTLYALYGEDKASLAVEKWDNALQQWSKICNAPADTAHFAVLSNGAVLFGVSRYGTQIWKIALTPPAQANWMMKTETGGYRFAATPDGIVFTGEERELDNKRSTDYGATWRAIRGVEPFEQFYVSPNYKEDASVFALSRHGRVYKSTSRGETWIDTMEGINQHTFFAAMAFSPDYSQDQTLYVADKEGRLFISQDRAASWTSLDVRLPSGHTLNSLVILPNKQVIAGTDQGLFLLKNTYTPPSRPVNSMKEKMTVTFTLGKDTYRINGEEWLMDDALPYYKDGRLYVPVRYLAKGLGIADKDIRWNEATREVTLTKGDKTVKLYTDKRVLLANDKATLIDVYPEVTNNRLHLPVRWVAEAFGATVTWNDFDRAATILYEKKVD